MRILAASVLAAALPLMAGANLRGHGKKLFWRDGKVTLRVSRTVHWEGGGETGVDRRETAASAHAAVFEGVRAWVRAGRAAVEVDLDFSNATTVSAGENLITFTDPAPFDTGLCHKERHIVCTLLSYTGDGEIASAAVAFNPYKRHSSIGLAGTHDLGAIMLHEMGHVLGLDHAFVRDSVMLAETEQEPAPFTLRRLAEDDLSTLAALYPRADAAAPGSIAGRVLRDGAPVAGARVMAADRSGRVVHGAWSGEDGGFVLPVSAAVDSYTIAADADGVAAVPAEPVAVGGVVDVLLPAVGELLSVDSVGVIVGGIYGGRARVDLARGRDHVLALTRQPVGAATDIVLPAAAEIARTGNANSPASAPRLVRLSIRIGAEAPVGSYLLAAASPETGAIALLPGALRVVGNPRITGLRDGVTALRRGARYVLEGRDLTPGGPVAAMREFEGAPYPTQLAGVAVRLGPRFVPLDSVSASEIEFEAPVDAEAGEAKLTVVVGSAMESNPWAVTVTVE